MKKTVFFLLVLAGTITGRAQDAASEATCPSWGPYVEAQNLGNKNGLLLMCDIMADSSCITYHTYWSTINYKLGPRGGYCGIQRKTDDGGVFNNIFSIWDLKDSDKPQCFAEYQVDDEYVSGFGGEGTGLHSHNNMPWIPGHRYCTVVRRWYTGDNQTRIGFFMYDYSNHQWTHYITAVTPEENAFFTNTSFGGFLEKFSGEAVPRCGYWSNWWKLNEDGSWNKATAVKCSAGTGAWKAEQIDDSTVKLYSCGNYTAPASSYLFPVQLAGAHPSIAVPASISKAAAQYEKSKGQLMVQWAVDPATGPQLEYKIAVYRDKKLAGDPVYKAAVQMPQQRDAAIDTSLPKGKYFIALQVKNIFEQWSQPTVMAVRVP